MKEDDELLAIKAAVLYYEDDKTQDEIGSLLGITRWKVGRLIAYAKARGHVRIEVVHPQARRLPLERRLRTEFNLRDAVVAPAYDTAEDSDELQSRVALAAAEYLTSMRPVPKILGISWGRTLHTVSEALKDGWAHGVHVVQLNGGVSLNRKASSAADTAATIARKAHGTATLLQSPAILEQLSTKIAIEADRTVAQARETAREASAYLFSAGVADSDSVLVGSGYLSGSEMRLLVEKGAIGDVVGRFIDADGNVVDPRLDERTLGVTLEEVRAAQTSIAVIAGAAKRDVAHTVVTSGLCTVLITDERNAEYLLERRS